MSYPQKGGFDLDGVLALMDEALLAGFQREGKLLDRTIHQLVEHDFCRSFPGEISEDELRALFEDERLLEGIEPCPHLVGAARACAAAGDELHLVTARRRLTWPVTADWLRYHQIPHAVLAFVPAAEKADYVRANGLGYFVENRLDTATMIARHTPSFLVALPYNEIQVGSSANRNLWRWPRARFAYLADWLMGYRTARGELAEEEPES